MGNTEEQEGERPVTIADTDIRCGTCFYRHQLTDVLLECRFNPPMNGYPTFTDRGPVSIAFKITSQELGCGQWHTDTEPPARFGFVDMEK